MEWLPAEEKKWDEEAVGVDIYFFVCFLPLVLGS